MFIIFKEKENIRPLINQNARFLNLFIAFYLTQSLYKTKYKKKNRKLYAIKIISIQENFMTIYVLSIANIKNNRKTKYRYDLIIILQQVLTIIS